MEAIAEVTREQLYERLMDITRRLTTPQEVPGADCKLCVVARWQRASRMVGDNEKYYPKVQAIQDEMEALQDEWEAAHEAWLATYADGEKIPYINTLCHCDGCEMYNKMIEINDLVEAMLVREDFIEISKNGKVKEYLDSLWWAIKTYKEKAELFGLPVNMSAAVYGGWTE